MSDVGKPVPRPAPESLPYWEAAKQHRLDIPHCRGCDEYFFPPARICPRCTASDVDFVTVSGRGKIFSYVIFDRVYHPGFADDVPYAVALVELAEGPRLISNIIGIPAEQVSCDMLVAVVFDDAAGGVPVPKFKPV
jgi:uncharacterized OB-fold protein